MPAAAMEQNMEGQMAGILMHRPMQKGLIYPMGSPGTMHCTDSNGMME